MRGAEITGVAMKASISPRVELAGRLAEVQGADDDRHAGCLRAQRLDEPWQQGRLAETGQADVGQRVSQRIVEPVGERGGQQALPAAAEQFVVEVAAELAEAVADGRLADVQRVGRAGHAAGFVQQDQHSDQVYWISTTYGSYGEPGHPTVRRASPA